MTKNRNHVQKKKYETGNFATFKLVSYEIFEIRRVTE